MNLQSAADKLIISWQVLMPSPCQAPPHLHQHSLGLWQALTKRPRARLALTGHRAGRKLFSPLSFQSLVDQLKTCMRPLQELVRPLHLLPQMLTKPFKALNSPCRVWRTSKRLFHPGIFNNLGDSVLVFHRSCQISLLEKLRSKPVS